MIKRNIVVVGASAGGVAALRDFVSSLPADYTGSIFIVLHIPPYTRSSLDKILAASGPLPCVQPQDGDPILPGYIYVARNDHHLLVENDTILVKRGPKENRFRPSVDALFRSAAMSFGTQVIGIVMSGVLNDGTSGLWSVKRKGGIAMIQSRNEAEHSEMPENVLDYVEVDFELPAAALGTQVGAFLHTEAPAQKMLPSHEKQLLETEVSFAKQAGSFEIGIMDHGQLTPFTCPECHGSLVQLLEGKLIRFRCHTGHAYTASALIASINESVQELLWQGMRGLEEASMLLTRIGDHFDQQQNPVASETFRNQAEDSMKRSRQIQDAVFRQGQFSEDLRLEDKTGVDYEAPLSTGLQNS